MIDNNFFQNLIPLLDGLDSIHIVVSRVAPIETDQSSLAVVSVLPVCRDIKDKAKDQIIPLNFKGTPEELDNGFLDGIRKPIAEAGGLLSNIKEFEDSVKKADKESEKESRKKEEERKKEEKEKKERKENGERVAEALSEIETEHKDKPVEAVRKLEELQKKYTNLPYKVQESLENAITSFKNLNKQTNLFGL